MPPAAASPLCGFHEKRINDLETEISQVGAVQASTNTKIDNLTSQIQETRDEITGKLDKLLERSEVVATKVTARAINPNHGTSGGRAPSRRRTLTNAVRAAPHSVITTGTTIAPRGNSRRAIRK